MKNLHFNLNKDTNSNDQVLENGIENIVMLLKAKKRKKLKNYWRKGTYAKSQIQPMI